MAMPPMPPPMPPPPPAPDGVEAMPGDDWMDALTAAAADAELGPALADARVVTLTRGDAAITVDVDGQSADFPLGDAAPADAAAPPPAPGA